MLELFKKYRLFFLVMFALSAIILTLFYNALKPQKQLPIYTPSMVNAEMVDSTIQHIANKKMHHIADFEFTNQNGKTITNKDYENTIYIADFFFTTCQTICPIMTDNMVWVQDQIQQMDDVKILSHTVIPEIDTPEVLKAYALKKGVNEEKWNLVTGKKEDIYYIARKSYLAVKTGDPSQMYDMVHTENFILVDKKRRVRGFYDGTKMEDMEKLIEDIKILRDKN
nr:SCO family protein [uncultured Flavobacterium sp.]